MTSQDQRRRTRKPNWSKDEQAALVTAITPVYPKLFGRLSNTTTNEVKTGLWDGVHQQVNFVSQPMARPCERGLQEMKVKYVNLKSKTKKKAAATIAAMKRTGGGEMEDSGDWNDFMDSIYSLDRHEKIVAKLIGKEGVIGITGFNLESDAPTEPIIKLSDNSQHLVIYTPLTEEQGPTIITEMTQREEATPEVASWC